VIAKVFVPHPEQSFLFVSRGGRLLGWQRKLRYQKRCDLFLYTQSSCNGFREISRGTAKVESISRDYFVTLTRNGKKV